jgi:hypothetical protein
VHVVLGIENTCYELYMPLFTMKKTKTLVSHCVTQSIVKETWSRSQRAMD